MTSSSSGELVIREASVRDVPQILQFIRGLADYEKLGHECAATEEQLERTLFGERPMAEVVMAFRHGLPAGFALYFHNYSTFLAQPGIYLEDLFVDVPHRGFGVGQALLAHLAATAVERECGRLEWAVLDWNADAIRFYERMGARAMSDWTTYRVTGEALVQLAKIPKL